MHPSNLAAMVDNIGSQSQGANSVYGVCGRTPDPLTAITVIKKSLDLAFSYNCDSNRVGIPNATDREVLPLRKVFELV